MRSEQFFGIFSVLIYTNLKGKHVRYSEDAKQDSELLKNKSFQSYIRYWALHVYIAQRSSQKRLFVTKHNNTCTF